MNTFMVGSSVLMQERELTSDWSENSLKMVVYENRQTISKLFTGQLKASALPAG